MVLSYGKIIDDENEVELNIASDLNAPTSHMPHDGHILRLTIKTLYWSIVALAFALALFVIVFPYPAIRFYTELNLKQRALETAEIYVRRNDSRYDFYNQPEYDSRYADALDACIRLSLSLMDDGVQNGGYYSPRAVLYAQKADTYIEKYLGFSNSMSNRNRQIETYSLANRPYIEHVYLYSNEDYLMRRQAEAKIIAGKSAELYSEFFTHFQSFPAKENINEAVMMDYAKIFNRFSAALNTELNILGYNNLQFTSSGMPDMQEILDANLQLNSSYFKLLYSPTPYGPYQHEYPAGKSPMLINIEANIQDYIDFTKSISTEGNRTKTLEKLFYAKSLADVITKIRNIFELMYYMRSDFLPQNLSDKGVELQGIYEYWDTELFTTEKGFFPKTVLDWVAGLIIDYGSTFTY